MSAIKVIGRLHFRVPSETKAGVFYLVDLESQDGHRYYCDCPAHTKNRHHFRKPCKHMAACVAMIEESR